MSDVGQLRAAITIGSVLTPGDDGYEDSLKRWSATAEKRAAVVVKAANAEEVAAAIKFAVANKLPLTARGGGHSSSGTSSSEGMVVDLSNMRAVSVDQDAMTASFGGGCVFADLDRVLDPLGLAIVGGVVNHTGVGGLILGGGHGYLTPKHGLTIDNLLSVQIVTADGSILEASEKENEDLFWAVRGAGVQFGVVTRFTSRIHKQGEVWSGALVFTPDKLPDLVAAVNDFHNKDNRDGHCLTMGIGYGPDGTSRVLTVSPFYQGPVDDARKFFSKILDIGPIIDMTTMMTVGQVNQLLNPLAYHGIRRLMGSGNAVMPLDAATLQSTADKFWSFCDARPGVGAQSAVAVEFFPTHKILEVPHDATAYSNRGDYYDVVTMFGWTDEARDGELRAFNRELVAHIRDTLGYKYNAREGGDAPVGRYINLETDPVKPEDAYGANLKRLRVVKRKFDPENVFHKWHGVNVEVE
ncbi:6-hydroxy-D-nicotine oxidase-like protein [Hapsidospora chrysogenum ATCC 11550]|uniref:6-hydroxy-D-nicotine oxidase-like protein n=1 Tax=Hapsidospora chrysogenum (strain ATCC 11550 / CBS 779.69 / DSM 880 / IAM 14645 / JCM 23072 / IMI 49137) TaxID=857340 RepID=A0A086T4U8_HAPC1|nr:6-hydroxy-D-nicotine oxidase-like protein [Hapsidospora chrysogenum ATCC 11550]